MTSASRLTRIGVIGECLIELKGTEFGTLHQSFGGDTLNTALYLARLSERCAQVQYITVLGSDSLSDVMMARWQEEGIGVDYTLRDPARMPGLYQILIDERGERRFLYWRQNSAARFLMQHPDLGRVAGALAELDVLYLSGISLAILPSQDRAALIELLVALAARGVPIAFDTNYRSALWSSVEEARDCIAAIAPATRLMFATFEDEHQLWGDDAPQRTIERYTRSGIPTIVVKLGGDGCLLSEDGTNQSLPTARVALVVDTTAAGDSFNAAYLAAWLQGRPAGDCCRAGNAMAGIVIQHRGAIIPASLTPSLRELLPGNAGEAAS